MNYLYVINIGKVVSYNMLKYVDTKVVFQEVPDEITLAINISNCPCNCKNCHSSYLAQDIGEELNSHSLKKLIDDNKGITCISFMGGDSSPLDINTLAQWVKINYPLKVAWYSGRHELSKDINIKWFSYIKLGPYIEELGPLNSKTTNQKMYEVVPNHYDDGTYGYELEDITYKFFKKHED